jgi:hypothetical protein
MKHPFEDQKYYMHKNAMDTAIQIRKIQYLGPEYIRMKTYYINLGYTGKPWVLREMNNFVVEDKEYANWIRLPFEKVFTARTKSGLPE